MQYNKRKTLGECIYGKTVKIKCKYYQLRAVSNGNITENLYDLRQWINDIEEMPLDQRKRNVNNIVGRLEEQVVVGDSECYVLNFMRMDEVSTVYKVKETSLRSMWILM